MTQPMPGDEHKADVKAWLVAIVESSDDAIVSKTLNGIVTSWNAGAERIFGYTAREMIGRPIATLFPPDRLNEEPEILARLHRGERVDHFETVRVTKDGRLIEVSVTISPVRDATGQVVGASKIARDITAQKRYERELKMARDAAETANRAKDHFLSVLSHELRTPLTPVLGAISLIERDASVPAHLVDHVRMIRRNVETEARLVDDLLDLTRITRGKLFLHNEVVDVHPSLRNVIDMFDREVQEKGLTVITALRARDFHVWADPGRFQQILLNLVSNAVKFTPKDGAITLRTSNENGSVRIELSDTGVGIDTDLLPRLFRPFEQGETKATRQFGGLGLGLSIVKALVELHGGSVTAASDGKGKGATFTVRVGTAPHTAPSAGAGPRAADAQAKAYRVLLVEDHADTREMLSLLLSSFGHSVTAAASVREAVEAAERQQFDLLLSDIGLPDGSGLDVMRHLASRSQNKVKGIALSGFGQDEDLRRSREAGFATHLTKPVNLQTLQDTIKLVAP